MSDRPISDRPVMDLDPVGLEFYDNAAKRRMKYVYPDSKHWTAGWLLYKHPEGQWVTLRRATEADIRQLNKAVIEAHHDL